MVDNVEEDTNSLANPIVIDASESSSCSPEPQSGCVPTGDEMSKPPFSFSIPPRCPLRKAIPVVASKIGASRNLTAVTPSTRLPFPSSSERLAGHPTRAIKCLDQDDYDGDDNHSDISESPEYSESDSDSELEDASDLEMPSIITARRTRNDSALALPSNRIAHVEVDASRSTTISEGSGNTSIAKGLAAPRKRTGYEKARDDDELVKRLNIGDGQAAIRDARIGRIDRVWPLISEDLQKAVPQVADIGDQEKRLWIFCVAYTRLGRQE